MKIYRAGVIGCGRIGSKLEDDPLRAHPCTHAGAYAYLANVKLVAGVSHTEKSARQFSQKWGTKTIYTDYREMLDTERLDLVSITTYPQLHPQMVVEAAKREAKGILCEKPLALSLGEASEMIEACKKSGTVLMTVHNRRWNSLYIKARELVRSGEIGDLVSVVGICQGCKPRKDWQSQYEGPLLHDATHLFDILRFFCGDAEWVIGDVERKSKEYDVEDLAYAYIYFKNGVTATTLVNERTSYMRFEIELQGSRGKIVLGNDARMWKFSSSKYATGFKELTEVEFPTPKRQNNVYVTAIRELIKSIETGRTNSSTGEDGKAALELIMAIYESKRRSNLKVGLPLKVGESLLEIAIKEGAF